MELIGPNSVRSDRYKGKRQKLSRAEGSSRSWERRTESLPFILESGRYHSISGVEGATEFVVVRVELEKFIDRFVPRRNRCETS